MSSLLLLSVALGGSVGAVARYLISLGVNTATGAIFPFGTLTVNVTGSFLIGFLSMYFESASWASPNITAGVLTGTLGALTTFSTFSMETFRLLESNGVYSFLSNITLNVILCLIAVWIGVVVGRLI